MFAGEDTIRFRSNKRGSELEAIIEHALDRLGRVEFFKGGVFELVRPRLQSAMSATAVTGRLSRGARTTSGSWTVSYTVRPTALCWVVVVLGVIFLFLLFPFTAKGEVQRTVSNALRDVRHAAED